MTDRDKTDALLRRALGGVEAPSETLLRQVKASLGKEQDMKTNRTTKRIITLALAAALVLALGATAYAVYMASIEDYVAEPAEAAETGAPAENYTRISWNGYQGTPEYEAWTQWQDWYDANVDDMLAEAGNTPVDSPYANYEDYTDEGRQVLEDIAEKNGVKLHTAIAPGSAEDIYEVLGTKPFLPEELLLRVRAVLRRVYQIAGTETVTRIGGAVVDWEAGTVTRLGESQMLTAKEYALLKKLCENRGKIVSIDRLCDTLWPDGSYGLENSLMVHIRRLREKLEPEPSAPEYLVTVRGLGYKMK